MSRRSYGVVSGIVGAGGNVGAIVTQVIFFGGSTYSPVMTVKTGLKWMGVMTLAVTVLLAFVHFPTWGSMFLPGNPDYTEEDYYIKEWTAEEVAQVRELESPPPWREYNQHFGEHRGICISFCHRG